MVFSRWVLVIFTLFIAGTLSENSWQTLSGKPPVVIARGGFSGVFPDSSSKAYQWVSVTISPNVALWCDLQLTKDGVGICFPDRNLDNGSDVTGLYPNKKEWFSVDFTWKDLSDVKCKLVQNVKSRSGVFDGSYQILTVEIVAELGAPGLWLNIQNSAFYKQPNLSMRNYVLSLSKRVEVNFISSPEISFLKSMKKDVTKLIFRFLNQDQIEPSKNLSYIKTFSSGILVPKSYIWPVGSDLYLKPHTSLVTDAHRQGLQVFASEFANDFTVAYNYSYDPTAEYLSFIDNGNFSVDGFLSDFPVTPYRAISCFSHLDTKDEKPGRITIISSDGASGDFPGCTDLAYEKAVKDGVDILDCNVKMSKDKIPFCMSSIDLLNTTNVFGTSFRNLSSTVAEIQERSGIYTFSLTMSQIKTLKPVISTHKKDHALFRNPRNKNAGKFLTLSEFLLLANRYNSLFGVLIKVENAVYLAEHQGINVVDAVLDKTHNQTTQESLTTSISVYFQSTDKSVLIACNEKTILSPGQLVYRVDKDISNVTDSAINAILSFAGTIVISMISVLPYNGGGLVRLKKTDVVPRLKARGLRVFVETFSNEFVTLPLDLYWDSTVEIDFFFRSAKIDGIITDFPATSARYKKNQCYRETSLFRTGELLPFANPMLLSPAQPPYPLLVKSDVKESPLPEVRSKQPPPSYAASKAVAKAIQVYCPFKTIVVLVIFFISV
ncbi:PREDICTED: glycerophosphodiester phosphodiesterase GDPDL5-like isoform X1 [Brassica oleracea var. oleracea]|uniref:glycerophosphodiester phosphodiesterase GDPDL5-like isoform X1 n=1 Tax=Brassica oleracea var. oleracea TaxID=109376 RepID=UPI0006A6DF5B|nr:PREDICTED: glycerophosphodiester phosphodiesterase GDPDL5-like isoform X1 [Brassica oleracea var. oleracea]